MAWVLLVLGLVGVAGCTGPKAGDAVTSVAKSEVTQKSADGTDAILSSEADRVRVDIRRAIRDVGWAVASVREVEPDRRWRGRGLLLDGREAVIEAWQVGETDRLRVRVRVGRFGEPAAERRWLEAFHRRLSGPRARTYGGRFELPPWPMSGEDGEQASP